MTSPPQQRIQRVVRVLLPLLVLGIGAAVAAAVFETRPTPKRRTSGPTTIDVEVVRLQPQPYRVQLRSQGTIRTPSRTSLVAEVAGRVVHLDPVFHAGGFVEKDQVLVKLDPRDYDLAVRDAAELFEQTKASLVELDSQRESVDVLTGLASEALAVQQRELKRVESLRSSGITSATDLADARRAVLSARTDLATQKNLARTLDARRLVLVRAQALATVRAERAKLALERTVIKAPFRGRVLSRTVGLGRYVAPGTQLGVIYGLVRAEVRLPLTVQQLAQLDLPLATNPDARPRVTLTDGSGATWTGRVGRTEGTVDTTSRHLFVVAEIPDPYRRAEAPLRVGSFVTASIEGRLLQGVFVIPRAAAQGQRDEVLVVDGEGMLRRRPVTVAWRDDTSLVVRAGLAAGERLCVTPVVFGGETVKARATEVAPTTSAAGASK